MLQPRILLILGALFGIGLMPLIFLQPSGASAAGLSGGFMYPLEHMSHVLIFVVVGMWSARLSGSGVLLLPLSFVLMLFVGASTDLNMLTMKASGMITFTAVMLYAITLAIAHTRQFLVSTVCISPFAFYLGSSYAANVPNIAGIGSYLMGTAVAAILVMGCGMCLAVASNSILDRISVRLRKIPAIASLLTFL